MLGIVQKTDASNEEHLCEVINCLSMMLTQIPRLRAEMSMLIRVTLRKQRGVDSHRDPYLSVLITLLCDGNT